MVRRDVSAGLLLVALSSGCASSERSVSPAVQAWSSEGASQPEKPFIELMVPGHEAAVVSVPRSEARRRPLLVAAHGAWDRPEPHCALWRRVVADRAFVLCPRGIRTNRHAPHSQAAYYYPDHFALAREVLAAMDALVARYQNRVDASRAVWAGFSQGAIHGALLVTLHPEKFPRAVLIEGGNGFFNEWSPYSARKYARAGERVLFGCGSVHCVRTAERCAGYLEPRGVAARITHAEGAGHSYGPAMETRLSENLEWVVAGDARWSPDP